MILTCIVLIIYCIINLLKKNLIVTPIKLISFWWIALFFISTLSLTGLYPPGLKTQIICLLMILGFNLGSFVPPTLLGWNKPFANERVENFLHLFYKITYMFLLAIVGYYFAKSIMMMTITDGFTYRLEAFSTTEVVGKLFESKLLENLYFFISSPLLFFLTIYGIAFYYCKNKLEPFVIALILNILDGTMRLARINIYCTIVLFFFTFLLKKNLLKKSLLSTLKPILICFLVGVLIIGIGTRRRHNISQQAELFLIDYHTVGFTLFDLELKNPLSKLNTENTYGRLFFGGLETIATICIRQVNKTYMSPALNNAILMGENRVTGIEKVPSETFHGIKRHNSFYTILYTLYSDGKFFGVFLGGLLLGGLLKIHYFRWQAFGTTLNLMWVILLANTMLFSIFISQLEIMRTWMLFIGLLITEFYYRQAKAAKP